MWASEKADLKCVISLMDSVLIFVSCKILYRHYSDKICLLRKQPSPFHTIKGAARQAHLLRLSTAMARGSRFPCII